MKNKLNSWFLCLLLGLSINAFSQINLPRGSQRASVSQCVGISDVTISYARPHVNDREIWGKLVPYGYNNLGFGTATAAPWRAGADENTTITFTHDVSVEGKPIEAGTYGFHIAVHPENKATIIFSHDSNSWGSFFYDESKDALRVEISTKEAPHHELLTFAFNSVNPTSTTASLIWEKKEFPFTIEVPVADIVLADFRDKSKGQQGFLRQNWENAARFALNNGGDLEEALGWIDQTIEGQFYSQNNFNNVSIKAQILNKMGKTEEYESMMDEAAGLANMNQLNALGYQMLTAKDYERAIRFFKMNVEKNPTVANCYDSLGEGYKMAGDKENAVKALQKALSLNPPANVKANSEKLLKELGVKMQ